MIRIADAEINEGAGQQLKLIALSTGYNDEDAQHLADQALIITAQLLRNMDPLVEAADPDNSNRLVIQGMVLNLLSSTIPMISEAVLMKSFHDILTRRPRR